MVLDQPNPFANARGRVRRARRGRVSKWDLVVDACSFPKAGLVGEQGAVAVQGGVHLADGEQDVAGDPRTSLGDRVVRSGGGRIEWTELLRRTYLADVLASGVMVAEQSIGDISAHLDDHQEVRGAWFEDDCRPSQAAESALRQIGTPEALALLAGRAAGEPAVEADEPLA